jgi:hypothetical protein
VKLIKGYDPGVRLSTNVVIGISCGTADSELPLSILPNRQFGPTKKLRFFDHNFPSENWRPGQYLLNPIDEIFAARFDEIFFEIFFPSSIFGAFEKTKKKRRGTCRAPRVPSQVGGRQVGRAAAGGGRRRSGRSHRVARQCALALERGGVP